MADIDIWASGAGAVIQEPADAKKETGFVACEQNTVGEWNWLFNQITTCINSLETSLNTVIANLASTQTQVSQNTNDIAALNDTLLVSAPVGVIFPFAGATIPSGWLLCDGSSFTSLPLLEAVLGGTTLPDLRDRNLRGAGSKINLLETQEASRVWSPSTNGGVAFIYGANYRLLHSLGPDVPHYLEDPNQNGYATGDDGVGQYYNIDTDPAGSGNYNFAYGSVRTAGAGVNFIIKHD